MDGLEINVVHLGGFNLKQRIVTGVIAGLVFITLLSTWRLLVCRFNCTLSIIGYREYLQMNGYMTYKLTALLD